MQIFEQFKNELSEFQPTMENAFFPFAMDNEGNIVFNRLKTVSTEIKINSVTGQFIAHTIILRRKLLVPTVNFSKSQIEVRTFWKDCAEKILGEGRSDYKILIRIVRTVGKEGLEITITNTKRLISQPVGMAMVEEMDKLVEKFITDFSKVRDVTYINEI